MLRTKTDRLAWIGFLGFCLALAACNGTESGEAAAVPEKDFMTARKNGKDWSAANGAGAMNWGSGIAITGYGEPFGVENLSIMIGKLKKGKYTVGSAGFLPGYEDESGNYLATSGSVTITGYSGTAVQGEFQLGFAMDEDGEIPGKTVVFESGRFNAVAVDGTRLNVPADTGAPPGTDPVPTGANVQYSIPISEIGDGFMVRDSLCEYLPTDSIAYRLSGNRLEIEYSHLYWNGTESRPFRLYDIYERLSSGSALIGDWKRQSNQYVVPVGFGAAGNAYVDSLAKAEDIMYKGETLYIRAHGLEYAYPGIWLFAFKSLEAKTILDGGVSPFRYIGADSLEITLPGEKVGVRYRPDAFFRARSSAARAPIEMELAPCSPFDFSGTWLGEILNP